MREAWKDNIAVHDPVDKKEVLYRSTILEKDYPRYREFFESQGGKFMIPISYLWGRQPLNEYDRKKETRVKKLLKEQGTDFLTRNPIWAVLMPVETGMVIEVLEGHHRTRFASAEGIKVIPTLLVHSSDLAQFLQYDEKWMITLLCVQADTTTDSFSRHAGRDIQPHVITTVHTMDDLAQLFKSFTTPRSQVLTATTSISTRAFLGKAVT